MNTLHSYQKKWQILFVTTSSSVLVCVDVSAIPIALPLLEREFSLSAVAGLWIVNIYLLTILAFFLISGKLAHLFGKKKIFSIGLAIFGLGSLCAALSQNGMWLIVSRGIQGAGGALSFPTMTAILLEGFPINERAKALGINAGISSVFLLIGPAIGGYFVEYLNWRYIFWVNVPIVIYGLIASAYLLPKEHVQKGKLHLLGSLFAMLSTSSLVVALMEGGKLNWTSFPVILLLVAAVIFASLFFYVSKDAKDPLVEFSLLKNFRFNILNLFIFLSQILLSFSIFLAIYIQKHLYYSPFQAGLLIAEGSLPIIIFSPLSGYLSDHISPRLPMVIGSLLLIVGFCWLFIFPEKTFFSILAPFLLITSGVSFVREPSFSLALSDIPDHSFMPAVTLLKATRQFAATFGLALIAAIIKTSSENASYEEGFYYLLIFFITFSVLILIMSLFFIKTPTHSIH